jgi:hypothetical protein
LIERFRADDNLHRPFVDSPCSSKLTRQLLGTDLDELAVRASSHPHLTSCGRKTHGRAQPGTFVSQLVEQFTLRCDGALEPVDPQLTFRELRMEDGCPKQAGEDEYGQESGEHRRPTSATWNNNEVWTIFAARLSQRLHIT